jgi:hypothetical protein
MCADIQTLMAFVEKMPSVNDIFYQNRKRKQYNFNCSIDVISIEIENLFT